MFVVVMSVFALAALGVLVWYAVAAPGSQVLGNTLVKGDGATAKIALTFDDGPGEATLEILEVLRRFRRFRIFVTFFLCGKNVERYPEIARRIAEDGHEIGNHTYSHPWLLWKTPGRIALEIERAQNVIAHRTGQRPKLFRPPYGLRWFGLFPILAQKEMTAVMWSVNGYDWRLPAREIARRVVRGARPGSIILLHDGVPPGESGDRKQTAEALEEILRELQERFEFVKVSEMLSEPQSEPLSEPRP